MAVNVDWRSIRPLNGGRDKGFEELCSQLARSEVADCARFVRKGSPDAGVECYAIFGNDSECAWQAKYFLTLGDSQWPQIDRSVRTALQKHPRLTHYVVCLPMDLPDARVPGQESALAKWNSHVEKWAKWASERGMMVDFAYWGSSELLERLSSPEHIGRLRFWFGTTGFDDGWFARRFEEARDTAGPRYTPEVHVDLPIAGRFEAFGRTNHFFDRTIALIRGLATEWASACSPGPSRLGKEWDPGVEAAIRAFGNDAVVQTAKATIEKAIDEIVAAGSAMEVQPSGTLPFNCTADKVAAVEAAVDGVVEHLSTRQTQHRAFSQYRYQFETFAGKLRKVREELREAQRWGGAKVMIVRGQTGTGKTHLLCDITRRRLAEGCPSVLLLGQSFTSDSAPWPQAAELLDASDSSAAEFVGALECAAQAAGVRALVLIDALNEGRGLSVWQTHLPGFLAHFTRSDWVGIVISIRSSYDGLISEEVREHAVVATHRGFGEHSYDAMRTFFTYYGLDLPSTPLIAPEFGSPLFLKTLCLGLQGQGETRLRKDIHGITGIFSLYISSVDKRVATRLGLSPWKKMAEKALRALCSAFPTASERWLAVEAAEALVNGLLPGRPYEESLYRALVIEGLLVQDVSGARRRREGREIVFIAYERIADHLVSKTLLETHFDGANAMGAFAPGGGMAEVVDGGYATQGIREALCIQLPERTGREVTDLVPRLAQTEDFAEAFTQSLVWRHATTFSERTSDLVRTRLEPGRRDLSSILDALLTLATTPEHPLNARFLNARLRQDEMPARDVWWSTYLHHATAGGRPARRLQDWALAVSPTMQLDDDVVELSAMTLAWMLAASNRPARDRATKSLVNLLTGRLAAAARLVDEFEDVDDPYVVERVYAVAYGVATRSHDPAEVKILAEHVYARVFAIGVPPANILLRDYARGVVERALYLGSLIDVDVTRIRPPYNSAPPVFPSEEDVAPLLPSSEHSPSKREDEDWARSHIGHSVLEGNLHLGLRDTWGCSGEWLSLGLDQPAWQEPSIPENGATDPTPVPVLGHSQIDRYVLRRVFELGWTTDRFGKFDRAWDLDGNGQFSTKESIGRKYQRIAYHEVLGLIADHFQYREYPADVARDHRYVGPWQNWLRDIDPTRAGTLPGEMAWSYRQGHSRVWWTAGGYDGWEDVDRLENWAQRQDDLPRIEDLLMVRSPEEGTRWLNCSSYFRWRQGPPVGRKPFEVERGEVAWWITAHMTRAEDAEAFVEWGSAQPFLGAGIEDVDEVYNVFVGEHGWAPAAVYSQTPLGGLLKRARPSRNVPFRLEAVATKYPFRFGLADGPGSAGEWLQLPVQKIIRGGRLRWSGHAADFVDPHDNVATFDPSAHEAGPSALLVREEFVRELLNRHSLGMVWTVVCQKSIGFLNPAPGYPFLRISGAYRLSEAGPVGFMRPEVMGQENPSW